MFRSQAVSSVSGCWALGTQIQTHSAPQWCLSIAAGCAARGFAAPEESSRDTAANSSSSSTSSTADTAAQQHYPPMYAACVLERLPILKSPPPAWEASYKARQQLEQLQLHQLKLYPVLDAKQREAAAGAESSNAAAGQDTQPHSTAADASGAVDTMKRRLQEKLVLLVRAQHNALTAVDGAGSTSSSGSGSGSSTGNSAPAAGASWTFPHTAHRQGETMRQAAERALKETIGLSQAYFVGNAPMAHLDVHSSSDSGSAGGSSSSSSAGPHAEPLGRVFFHLAQVVNDPWDVEVSADVASGFAWVAKDELEQYIQDKQLLKLARRML